MKLKLYDEFIGLYSLNKTIANDLIPEGKTENYIKENGILEQDDKRAKEYAILKKCCDEVHKEFIENVLANVKLNNLEKLRELMNKNNKTEQEKKELEKLKQDFRKIISKNFTKNENFKGLFGREMITEKLNEKFKDNKEIIKIIDNFLRFTTYLKGFNENRKNIYGKEESNVSIAYRIIDENFSKFIENLKIYEKIKEGSIKNKLGEIERGLNEILLGKSLEEIFMLENFNNTLNQSGIDIYNSIIGGISTEKVKIKGINEYVNEHNQNCTKKERVPKLKVLFKQILSDRESRSFIPEAIKSDLEVLEILENLNIHIEKNIITREAGVGIRELIKNLSDYELDKIYIKNDGLLTGISQKLLGDWSLIKEGLKLSYDKENGVEDTEKYRNGREKYLKNRDSFSIEEINRGLIEIGKEKRVETFFIEFLNREEECDFVEGIRKHFEKLTELLSKKNMHTKGLPNDIKSKTLIKNYLESCKELQRFIKLLLGSGKETIKDERFYSELEVIWLELDKLTIVYNKVRNYVTKKPYSTEKIKLNFNNPMLLDGWSTNKEVANSCLMFRDKRFYYLGIINNNYNKEFKNYKEPMNDEDILEKMVYLQAADPAKDIQNFMRINGKVEKKNGRKDKDGVNRQLESLKNQHLPEDINRIRKERTYSREDVEKFNKKDLERFIDFYKELAIEYYSDYEFSFKNSKEYHNFKEFTDHINKQAYQINFIKVSRSQIYNLVNEGKLYLFKIYNKDFSDKSKGTKNLHTLYFKMLFDEKNLENMIYKLNGQAEIFFRPGSISQDKIISHEANEPIKNKVIKDESGKATTRTYPYEIIKDRRYTRDSFKLHVPITLNFSADEIKSINDRVRMAIKNADNLHIIGIDRGERNLIYVSVINMKGEVVEQKSFNIIKNLGNEKGRNYLNAIKDKEEGRAKARVTWDTIEGIKQIKEGYLSQVIHKICLMMEKYNGIVVLEDLNQGFKNSRRKFEVSVYQKFEKMLIEKLNYYVNKKKDIEEYGGLLKAYQLTNKFESFKKLGKQSGFLFYVNPWNTSKIDPTTGFVNLYKFKYESVDKAKSVIEKFERIKFNKEEDYFEFDIDYSLFGDRGKGTRTKWTLCSVGERIIQFRDNKAKNQWNSEVIDITERFKEIFQKNNIDILSDNLKEEILSNDSKDFFESLTNTIKIMTELRNSEKGSEQGDERDYIQSPVKNSEGKFFNSEIILNEEKNGECISLPKDADANGAYNIARKGLILIKRIKNTKDEELRKINLVVKNEDWLKFAQK